MGNQSQPTNNELIEQYRQLESNNKQIEQKLNQLSYIKSQKIQELEACKSKAQELFGTSDVNELRNIYQSNMEHNRSVIPQALDKSNNNISRIEQVMQKLGIK